MTAALQQLHIVSVTFRQVDDDIDLLEEAITDALQYDLVLLTGGVSVGDYDYVAQALERCQVQKLFHKVKQRPGKPLWFGTKESSVVFGLPGNPSSVLTCFYEYVVPAIEKMLALKDPFIAIERKILRGDYTKQPGLQHFLKGKLGNDGVTILDGQESYRMRSFALADCLVLLPEEETIFTKGDLVEVHVLPH